MSKRAGVSGPDRIQAFLYILLRDHMTFGDVESIMFEHIENLPAAGATFSEPLQAEYAMSIVRRLMK
jgi:hypothetical protein